MALPRGSREDAGRLPVAHRQRPRGAKTRAEAAEEQEPGLLRSSKTYLTPL